MHAVHLDQKLVECLLTFTIAVTAAMLADRVNLVNDNDTAPVFMGFFKRFADACRTHTGPFLHKLAAGSDDDGKSAFVRECFGEQRFAGTRIPVEQKALGELCAKRKVQLDVPDEVRDALYRAFGTGQAPDVIS